MKMLREFTQYGYICQWSIWFPKGQGEWVNKRAMNEVLDTLTNLKAHPGQDQK